MSRFLNNLKEFNADIKNLFLYFYYSLKNPLDQSGYNELKKNFFILCSAFSFISFALTIPVIATKGLVTGLTFFLSLLGVAAIALALSALILGATLLIFQGFSFSNRDGIFVTASRKLSVENFRELTSSITLTSRERACISNRLAELNTYYNRLRSNDFFIDFFVRNNAEDLLASIQSSDARQQIIDVTSTESSMSATLQTHARQFLNQIQTRYTPTSYYDTQWIDEAYTEMSQFLADAYHQDPIQFSPTRSLFKIYPQPQAITLPLQWHEFERLSRMQPNISRQACLTAYYQHPIHTAWRFFLKPNNWINRSSFFIDRENSCINDASKRDIALLWRAVKDEETFTPDAINPTLESRKSSFLVNFEQIVRAHNRDNNYKDDNKADAPSCSSGILNRVMEGMTGHPLLGFHENKALQHAKDILKDFLFEKLNLLTSEDFEQFQNLYNDFNKSFISGNTFDSNWLANQVKAPEGYKSLIDQRMTEIYKDQWRNANFKETVLKTAGSPFETPTVFYTETLNAALTQRRSVRSLSR
jgi:hypothetical protein